MRPAAERRWSWAIAIVVVLLVALAVLQYRWIGEVSRLERLRLEDAVAEAMLEFSDDVDREISRLAAAFLVPRLDDLEAALDTWGSEAEDPDLLAEVLVWWPGADEAARWNETAGTLEPATLPEDLRAGLARARRLGPRSDRSAGPEGPALVVPDPPTVVVPVLPGAVLSGSLGDVRRRSERMRRNREPGARLLLRLDETALRDELLPRRVEDRFGGSAALPVDVTILAPTDRGREVVYSTAEAPTAEVGEGSFVVPLLRVRFFPELREGRQSFPRVGPARPLRRRPGEGFRRPTGSPEDLNGWALVVDAAAGSLDATVTRLRRRNLAISSAILGVLGLSLALVLTAARRRQELATRQLALVAGITHELHTPLAALQAAAQNLEDGVVRDAERIREYGRLVRREGGRLQKLVDQTLALAGMQSGSRALTSEEVDLGSAVDRAIVESARGSDGAADVATKVVTELAPGGEPGPLTVRADDDALRRILVNLLTNARKYGRGRAWVGARREGDRVTLYVVDDGPGVVAGERANLFEPFHRGRRARELTAPGSGLGLYLARSLAEAMGGTLTLADATSSGAPADLQGAVFRLELPTEPSS